MFFFTKGDDSVASDRSKKLAKSVSEVGVYQSILDNSFEQYAGLSENKIQEMIDESISDVGGGISSEEVQEMIDESLKGVPDEEKVNELIEGKLQPVYERIGTGFLNATISENIRTVNISYAKTPIYSLYMVAMKDEEGVTINIDDNFKSGTILTVMSERIISFTFEGLQGTSKLGEACMFVKAGSKRWLRVV